MAEAFDAVGFLSKILTEHGPLLEDDIARQFRDSGVDDPDSALDDALDEMDCPVNQLLDDRWVWLPSVLSGRVFTHRLGADEVAHDLLTVALDLDPITELCEHDQYRRLADGSAVRVAVAGFDDELLEQRGIPPELVDPVGTLVLPPGTLSALGVAEGDLVGVRLTTSGLAVERVATEPSLSAGEPAGELLAATLDTDEPAYFNAAVWTACVENPTLFTEPLPPLSDIIDHHGLAHHGELLAPNGFDFPRWLLATSCEALARRHDIEPDDALVLHSLLAVYDQMSLLLADAVAGDEPLADALEAASEGATPPEIGQFVDLVAEVGAELADPHLAQLLLAETVGTGRAGAAALGLFAEVMEPKVPRSARVAFRWLRGVALERMGDIVAAERELLAAESMDVDWPLPLFDLARIASDRGDVERGLALLRRADAGPDHPMVQVLQTYRSMPRSDVGRNEPCPCGSGRKYKKCHLGHEQLTLADRVSWLYMKACQHAILTGWTDLVAEVGYERSRHANPYDDEPDGLGDPLVIDAVLFEGGAFEEFLQMRGSLLPDDERLLAEQWLLLDRSVFEVEQVQPGQSVTVRDVRTGDTHDVRERTASRELKPGHLVCTRVAPAGDSMQFFGGLEPVALHERDRLIDLLDTGAEPAELVAYLSRRFAPPTLTNTEGDPLAICEATVRVGDPPRLAAVLDDTYDRVDGEEPPCWFEHVTTHGMERIRATLVLDGDSLRVQANSEKRMDRLLATLSQLDAEMTVLDDSRRPVRNAREAAELAKQLPPSSEGVLDPDDPELAVVLDEFIRNYETAWLDEPIPALDGHTPRQAADDPTRRADLVKLLDTFPAADAGRGGMDVDRLRAALGLP